MPVAYRHPCRNQSKRAYRQSPSTAPGRRSHFPRPSRRGQIAIATCRPSPHTSRGFIPWRLSYAGLARVERSTWPASETLHNCGPRDWVGPMSVDPPIAEGNAAAPKTSGSGRCCSLIPGLDVKLSATILAGSMVLSAVELFALRMMGLGDVGGSMCRKRVAAKWRCKASDDLTIASVPAGTYDPARSGNSC